MNIVRQIQEELMNNVDEKTKKNVNRFFKEEIKSYGVSIYVVSKIANKYFKEVKDLSFKEIISICEKLLNTGYFEEACVAYKIVEKISDRFGVNDFNILERWLKIYVSNWAECDTLCNHTVGNFIESNPLYVNRLKEWAISENRWVRRGASVSIVLQARKGMFLEDIFEIATILLYDEDDLVQKGYGWMLKEASKQHTREVFDFIQKNKKTMPRTALRYAIEKMPKDLKIEAMKK